jgi:type I restriction enzyme S subunit
MTDGPYKLPSGWRWVRLEEVCVGTERRDPSKALEASFMYVDIAAIDNTAGQIVSPKELKGVEAPSRARKVIRLGDVIFATTRPYLKNIALVPFQLDNQICSTGYCVVRVNPELADPKYIFYLCRSDCIINQLNEKKMRGASYPAVTDGDVYGATIPLPPLGDQRRIVARVEALMERVREAKRLREGASRDTDPLMQSALAETLRELRSSYASQAIGQLRLKGKLEVYGGGTPSKENKTFWEGAIPWVSPKDMKRWVIDSTEDHISPGAVEASSAKIIPAGAVLAVVRGMILARSWPIAVSDVDLTINQDMKALVPKAGILSKYLGYVLKSLEHQVLGQVETAAHGTRRLRTSTLESLEVPTPPLTEQHRVIAYLDSVQTQAAALKRAQGDTDAELCRLEQAILDRAFRGEL